MLWSCYAVACVRSFALAQYFSPPEGETFFSVLVKEHASIIFVHGTFTVSVILTTWFILRTASEEGAMPPPE